MSSVERGDVDCSHDHRLKRRAQATAAQQTTYMLRTFIGFRKPVFIEISRPRPVTRAVTMRWSVGLRNRWEMCGFERVAVTFTLLMDTGYML